MALSPRERLIEHALRLITRAEVETPDAAERAREALARWRASSPDHEEAAREALRRWQMLAGMAGDLRQHFGEPGDAPARPGRRQLLRMSVAVAGVTALAAAGLSWQAWREQQALFAQTYRTGTAHTQMVSLPDAASGSQLDLNAQTLLHVRLYRDRRQVVLERGDARFDVAPDRTRPFTVETRAGTLTVVGTAFTVSDRGGPVSVSVEHGHVRWQRTDGDGHKAPAIDLRAGQMLTARAHEPDAVSRVDAAQAHAWREGWLVFDNVRLDEALPLINAYRVQPISLADARVGALPLTGRFRATDSDGLVLALPEVLPLEVTRWPDGRIQLSLANRPHRH